MLEAELTLNAIRHSINSATLVLRRPLVHVRMTGKAAGVPRRCSGPSSVAAQGGKPLHGEDRGHGVQDVPYLTTGGGTAGRVQGQRLLS